MGDLDALHRISSEPNARLYLWDDEPVSEGTIRDLTAQSARMSSSEGIGVFGARMRAGENLLGFCGFVRLGDMDEMELGYELTSEVGGRGLATEASRVCLH